MSASDQNALMEKIVSELSVLNKRIDDCFSNIYPSSGSSDSNILNNVGFSLFRRQAHTSPATLTSYNDDAYGFDRWYVLTQTASIQLAQTAGDNCQYACQTKQNQASAQRFGVAQIIPAGRSIGLRGRTVTFQIRAKSSSTPALRVAILEWTGTADSVTSDVVNDWTNGSFTTGNFFKSTTMNVIAVSQTTNASSSYADFLVNGSISTSCNNIIVMVWSENTTAQNVTVDITKAGLFPTPVLQVWQERAIYLETTDCSYFFKSWVEVSQIGRISQGTASSTVNCAFYIPMNMRITPTASSFGTIAVSEAQTGINTLITSITTVATDENSSTAIAITVAAGLTAGRTYALITLGVNSAVWLDAEL